jgi:predicted membrane protein
VAVQVTTSSFIADMKVLGEKQAGFFAPITLQSADYKAAERRIRIETSHFISDVKVWSGDSTYTKVVNKIKASLN